MNADNISQENSRFDYRPRNLPHKFDDLKPVFITFRLKFTIPQSMMNEYNKKRTKWHENYRTLTPEAQLEADESKDSWFFNWFDELLAKEQETPQILDREDLTQIIGRSLIHFDNLRYTLLAYCVMPNHVHVLICLREQSSGAVFSPQHIVYSWKRYTATTINKLLQRQGSLWQKESYDHLIRNSDELYRTIDYIIQNPVKAGLVKDWKLWKGNYLHREFRMNQD